MKQMVLRMQLVAVVTAGLMATSCASAGHTPDQIVDHIAAYGARAAAILQESQELVIKATPSLIPADTTAKVMVQMREASAVGLKLTAALEAFDSLSPNDVAARSAQVTQINTILNELRRYTRVVLVFVGQNAVGDQLFKLYDNLDSVFNEIQLGIDKWQLSVH